MSKYRVNAIRPTSDGSAQVIYDVDAIDTNNVPLPHRRTFIRVPAVSVAAAEALPTNSQRNQAHKALLIEHAPEGWGADHLDTIVINNLAAKEASDVVNDRLSFPQTFNL